MSRILITSGPTRQYLDPVRYLTNASSGRMGAALAAAAIEAGHEVVIVSGPVEVTYPAGADVMPVVSTEDMLAACLKAFPACDGLIAVAAPCDYRPLAVAEQKIRKSGETLAARTGRDARYRGRAGGRSRRPPNGWLPSPWRPKTGTCGRCRSWNARVAT